jgi:hypothetical protein
VQQLWVEHRVYLTKVLIVGEVELVGLTFEAFEDLKGPKVLGG